MKLANPLNYPLAVLTGALTLIIGVRFLRIPPAMIIPASIAIATIGATVIKSREPERYGLDNPALERELQLAHQQSVHLAEKSNVLKTEATRLLIPINQTELLGTIQYACDRTQELPGKIERLAQQLQGADSLLSVTELQQQLREVDAKLQASSGVVRESLEKLAESLRRNIELARQGQDARQAQVISLSTLILDAAGVLQALQNKLRTTDLSNPTEAVAVRSLSEELTSFHENVDLLLFQ
jgi:hypothetical protein